MNSTSTSAWEGQLQALRTALAAKDRQATHTAVSGLLALNAPLGAQWRSVSELMRMSGELSLALRAMDAFVAAAAHAPLALYSKAVLLTQCGRMREAHDCVLRLPPDVPDRAGRAYVLGNTAMTMGRAEEAREYLQESLRWRPGWGPAWLTLATAVNLAHDPLGERLLAEANLAQQQGPADLARYFYAVGKLHADRAEHDLAFDAFARGAQLLRGQTPYSRRGNEANAQQAQQGFGPGVLEQVQACQQRSTARSIFVTGLPRSGTTLVEQILASHSEVADGAELNLMQQLAVAAGGVSGHTLQQFMAVGRHPDELAALYLRLLSERFGPQGRIVDKSIDMSRFMGLIASVLPDAPLIWMRRDPLDCAWSCFRTFFIHGVGWSYDLGDIAAHFMLEDRLLAFWRERLGSRLLVVPYPELVAAPEAWTRRILAHCGLQEELAVHRPHDTQRVVLTASAMQVRQPINRAGLNVAAPYRHRLEDFVQAYSPPPNGLA